MTPEQIALEACYDEWHREHPTELGAKCSFCRPMAAAIQRCADAAVAEEREACAREVTYFFRDWDDVTYSRAKVAADRIRARGGEGK
jgi:hypothetical protein